MAEATEVHSGSFCECQGTAERPAEPLHVSLYISVHEEEPESAGPSHLFMPRLNLGDPEADSIFTAGFHQVL